MMALAQMEAIASDLADLSGRVGALEDAAGAPIPDAIGTVNTTIINSKGEVEPVKTEAQYIKSSFQEGPEAATALEAQAPTLLAKPDAVNFVLENATLVGIFAELETRAKAAQKADVFLYFDGLQAQGESNVVHGGNIRAAFHALYLKNGDVFGGAPEEVTQPENMGLAYWRWTTAGEHGVGLRMRGKETEYFKRRLVVVAFGGLT